MRIRDGSSDVCSSDLGLQRRQLVAIAAAGKDGMAAGGEAPGDGGADVIAGANHGDSAFLHGCRHGDPPSALVINLVLRLISLEKRLSQWQRRAIKETRCAGTIFPSSPDQIGRAHD